MYRNFTSTNKLIKTSETWKSSEMSEKRKAEETNDESREFKSQFGKYHTLDSDEEEISDTEHLNEDEIEGEEDGIARVEVDEDVKVRLWIRIFLFSICRI